MNRKSLLLLANTCLMITLMLGCNEEGFLDQTEVTDLNEQTVFADSTYTMNFLTSIYTDVGYSFNPARFGVAGLESACDEAEGFATGSVGTHLQFTTGGINPINIPGNSWSIPYRNIRKVNQYLKNVSRSRFNEAQKTRTKAEARFLRAWYYSVLLKHYGGVPIIGDEIYDADDEVYTTRNTYEECVNYILAECDAAALDLPVQYTGFDNGRVTRGACLALKARVLLYAASPLFNGEGFGEGDLRPIVGYPETDLNRWKLAADAAKAVMDMNAYELYVDNVSGYASDPGHGFQHMFDIQVNGEFIFSQMRNHNVVGVGLQLERLWLPPSRGGGRHAWPYQELVDAFPMRNGLAISDPASGYDESNPYQDRDPRLNYTVIYNGLPVFFREGGGTSIIPAYTYLDEPRGDGFAKGTPTGYYIYKMVGKESAANWIALTKLNFPLIRYAEILLNYAEAQNEFTGPDQSVYDALIEIRQRAEIFPGADGLYGLKAGMSKDEMREVIRNERRIELAYESHRFWDIRRWKIADQVGNRMMNGMRITKEGSNYTYQKVPVRQHNFKEATYLWPIPQSETGKSAELIQNPQY